MHKSEYRNYNIETILAPLTEGKVNVYTLPDKFVGYLVDRKTKFSYQSIAVYIAGVKSYLEFNDVDISSTKFRKKVTLPSKQMGASAIEEISNKWKWSQMAMKVREVYQEIIR